MQPLLKHRYQSYKFFQMRVASAKPSWPKTHIRLLAVAALSKNSKRLPIRLWTIKRALNKTGKVLHEHHWTILRPPEGLTWFTGDNPVIRLNISSPGKYNFVGGWNSRGTFTFLPLGPEHLLTRKSGEVRRSVVFCAPKPVTKNANKLSLHGSWSKTKEEAKARIVRDYNARAPKDKQVAS